MCRDTRNKNVKTMYDGTDLETLSYKPEVKLKCTCNLNMKDLGWDPDCPIHQKPSIQDIPKNKTKTVTISAQHAYSLRCLVKHYRRMIEHLGRGNSELTVEYCDELLEDLQG